jgi:hypothetical protein
MVAIPENPAHYGLIVYRFRMTPFQGVEAGSIPARAMSLTVVSQTINYGYGVVVQRN